MTQPAAPLVPSRATASRDSNSRKARDRRLPVLRAALPLAVVAAAGFLSGPWLVGFAARAWEGFFFPALVQMSLSGLRWCL